MPAFIVKAYCCAPSAPVPTGRASGGIGRSRWNGSNGPDADWRVNADVFLPFVRVTLSKSKEHTRAMPPKPRVSAARRVIPSRSQSITRVPCP